MLMKIKKFYKLKKQILYEYINLENISHQFPENKACLTIFAIKKISTFSQKHKLH